MISSKIIVTGQNSLVKYDFRNKNWKVYSKSLNVGKSFTSYKDAKDYFDAILVAEQIDQQFKPKCLSHNVKNNWLIVKYKKQSFNNDLDIITNYGDLASSVANFTVIDQEAIEQSLSKEFHNWLDTDIYRDILKLKNVVHLKPESINSRELFGTAIGTDNLFWNGCEWEDSDGKLWYFYGYTLVPDTSDPENYTVLPSDIQPDHVLICGFGGPNVITVIDIHSLGKRNENITSLLEDTATIQDMVAVEMLFGDKLKISYNNDKTSAILLFKEKVTFMGTDFNKGQSISLTIH